HSAFVKHCAGGTPQHPHVLTPARHSWNSPAQRPGTQFGNGWLPHACVGGSHTQLVVCGGSLRQVVVPPQVPPHVGPLGPVPRAQVGGRVVVVVLVVVVVVVVVGFGTCCADPMRIGNWFSFSS